MEISNVLKYFIMLFVVTTSTYFIPNCSIMNEHAIYIGLLAATTLILLDRSLPFIIVYQENEKGHH